MDRLCGRTLHVQVNQVVLLVRQEFFSVTLLLSLSRRTTLPRGFEMLRLYDITIGAFSHLHNKDDDFTCHLQQHNNSVHTWNNKLAFGLNLCTYSAILIWSNDEIFRFLLRLLVKYSEEGSKKYWKLGSHRPFLDVKSEKNS